MTDRRLKEGCSFLPFDRSIAMSRSEPTFPASTLSYKDRIVMVLEHEGNKHLRGLGTALYRLTSGRVAPRNRDVLLLTTRGRGSGREHTVLLQFFRDGENMIVVGANSGRSANPDWFYNLKATPMAHVTIMDRTLQVSAEQVSDEDAAVFWQRILRRAPSYARYRRTIDRTIPLVRLVPMDKTEGIVSQHASSISSSKTTDIEVL
jgi:deazaflavin-dependent oxidoreductase (nitroreductase family)